MWSETEIRALSLSRHQILRTQDCANAYHISRSHTNQREDRCQQAGPVCDCRPPEGLWPRAALADRIIDAQNCTSRTTPSSHRALDTIVAVILIYCVVLRCLRTDALRMGSR